KLVEVQVLQGGERHVGFSWVTAVMNPLRKRCAPATPHQHEVQSARMPATAETALVRAIGPRQLTASIINITIGAGIFVLPAVAARGLGPAAPLAYVVCACLMALIVCCFAAAGSRVSLTGGVYAY